MQLEGKPAAFLVSGDVGRVLGALRDDLRCRHPGRHPLESLRGAVTELCPAAVGAVEDTEYPAIVHDRHRDHRLEALGRGLWCEVLRDLGGGAVVADPQRAASGQDLAAQPGPDRHDDAVQRFGCHIDAATEHDLVDAVRLTDPRHVDTG